MDVGSVKVIFIKQAIDFLADMFRFENISSDITQQLKDQSKKTIRNAADITGEVYDSFLKEQKTISIRMHLQSPEIVLPINTVTNKGPSLVFWPGNLTVIDGVTKRLLKKEKGIKVEKTGKRELYDSYNIKLDKMELEYCREFRMAKGDLFNKGLNNAISSEVSSIGEHYGDHEQNHDEFDENFSKKKRELNKLKKAEFYIHRRKGMFDSMFKDFSIGVKIELLKNIFVQLECSDAREKITAELSSLKLEANPEIINELMKLTQMFVLNEEQQNRLIIKRNMNDAIKMEHLEVEIKGSPSLNFVIATRIKLFLYEDIKQDDRPLETINFEDLPDLVFDKEGLRLVVKQEKIKDHRVIKFAKLEDFNKWELALSPIKKKLAIKRIKYEEEEKIRMKKLKLRQGRKSIKITNRGKRDSKEKIHLEIDETQKKQLEFGGEIIESEIHFRFTNFILVMDEGEKKFILLTKEMKVDVVKTTGGLDLEMSLLDFEVKREHVTETVKYMITSDYFSSLSSKIFKENIIQKQRKLINISFKQKKDQPQEAKIYFGCLFITLEPRIIQEFVECLGSSLITPDPPQKNDLTQPNSSITSEKMDHLGKESKIDEIQLSPKIYAHLENSDTKLNDLKETKKNITVEVTIENISLLLISTVNKTFIPLAQLMIEGGRVDCGVFAGAVMVDLKFKDVVCMDLTNYPNTLKKTDFEKTKPMKLFGRLKEKEKNNNGKIAIEA